jgi:hypothetical protein
MTACSRSNCAAPETTCDLGHFDLSKCPSWAGGPDKAEGAQETGTVVALPWSGSALGLLDLRFIAGRGKPMVVAILGPENAGKTTLLGCWYLLLGRGLVGNASRRFAGSYSLTGWEAVANALRWSAGWSPDNHPRFPPHTTSREGRAPGLLHLSFRSADGRLKDYVFTDAPGLWFQKWSINRDAVEAQGAQWIAENADVFLIVADCDALAGPDKGSARGAFQVLARRLAGERGDRPVALVWTKADVSISTEMRETVLNAVKAAMPDVIEFSVSVKAGASGEDNATPAFLHLLDWTLGVRRRPVSLPRLEAAGRNLFLVAGAR